MRSRRRTIRRVMQSRSVKKKSPTSASPRSMSSTRKTRQRLRTAYRSLGAVAVAVAVAALAALAVVAASVGEAVAAVAAAVAAVCPGVVAASAKQNTPTYLINASGHGRVRQDRDPANPYPGCGAALTHAWERLQKLAERALRLLRKCQRASWM